MGFGYATSDNIGMRKVYDIDNNLKGFDISNLNANNRDISSRKNRPLSESMINYI